ncbi:MAG: hypothetical protein IT299_09730 [Dehalococcoidia bacterium]|nr:hypothetical protein [Dehalococcoidia bacterium]
MTAEDDESRERPNEGAPDARDLLRHALVNDDDPRFPWWLPLPGVVLATLWAGWRAVSVGAAGAEAGAGLDTFLGTLLWPGAGIFILTCVATWAGWQLEID